MRHTGEDNVNYYLLEGRHLLTQAIHMAESVCVRLCVPVVSFFFCILALISWNLVVPVEGGEWLSLSEVSYSKDN